MKPKTNYKYMDTWMLIGMAMFRIGDQQVVSFFSFGSGVINWSSKKQPTVALSSMEAKYRGATIVACEIVWL